MGEDVAARVTAETEKVGFASPTWVNVARTVLEELVAEHGEIGKSFSVCEVFTDAPPGMAGPDPATAAWHFRVVDKTVTVGGGEVDDANMNVRADYEAVLPVARLVYKPQILARMERESPQIEGGSRDDRSNLPSYLAELHNRLALITK